MHMLDEQGPGIYAPNALTRLLAQPDYASGVTFWYVAPQAKIINVAYQALITNIPLKLRLWAAVLRADARLPRAPSSKTPRTEQMGHLSMRMEAATP